MALELDIRYAARDFRLSEEEEDLLARMLEEGLRREGVPAAEISLSFVGDEEIRELNGRYRGVDAPTDVLTFPLDDDPVLGDIVVSVPTARRQAEAYGHSLRREIFFLIVHGFYHLLGYDHDTEEAEAEMFRRQEELLAAFGITR